MAKRFAFVSGDIGGTRMMVPVAKLSKELGHEIMICADGIGKGIDVWVQEKHNFLVVKDLSSLHLGEVFGEIDLIFVSTCATASGLCEYVARECHGLAPIVMGADGFFNHGFKKWQAVQADYWFAITKGHAQQIRTLRPNFPPERVVVVDQPAFDPCLDLIPRKDEIRRQRRKELGLNDDQKAILWWSTGMGEIIVEDIEMIEMAIMSLSGINAVFMPRIHPKLEDTVGKGVDGGRAFLEAAILSARCHYE